MCRYIVRCELLKIYFDGFVRQLPSMLAQLADVPSLDSDGSAATNQHLRSSDAVARLRSTEAERAVRHDQMIGRFEKMHRAKSDSRWWWESGRPTLLCHDRWLQPSHYNILVIRQPSH